MRAHIYKCYTSQERHLHVLLCELMSGSVLVSDHHHHHKNPPPIGDLPAGYIKALQVLLAVLRLLLLVLSNKDGIQTTHQNPLPAAFTDKTVQFMIIIILPCLHPAGMEGKGCPEKCNRKQEHLNILMHAKTFKLQIQIQGLSLITLCVFSLSCFSLVFSKRNYSQNKGCLIFCLIG